MNNKNLFLAFIAAASLGGSVLAHRHNFRNNINHPVKITVVFAGASDNTWTIQPRKADYDDVGGLCTRRFRIQDLTTKEYIRSVFQYDDGEERMYGPNSDNIPTNGCYGYNVTIDYDEHNQPVAYIAE